MSDGGGGGGELLGVGVGQVVVQAAGKVEICSMPVSVKELPSLVSTDESTCSEVTCGDTRNRWSLCPCCSPASTYTSRASQLAIACSDAIIS